MELMLMTEACGDAFSRRAAALMPRKTLVCVTAMMRSYSFLLVYSITPRSETPALLTSTSRPSNSLAARCTADAHAASSATSWWWNTAVPRAERISAATASPVRSRMSVTTTLAPSSASRSALARPMPLPPPVTSATRPRNLVMCHPPHARDGPPAGPSAEQSRTRTWKAGGTPGAGRGVGVPGRRPTGPGRRGSGRPRLLRDLQRGRERASQEPRVTRGDVRRVAVDEVVADNRGAGAVDAQPPRRVDNPTIGARHGVTHLLLGLPVRLRLAQRGRAGLDVVQVRRHAVGPGVGAVRRVVQEHDRPRRTVQLVHGRGHPGTPVRRGLAFDRESTARGRARTAPGSRRPAT